VGTSESEGRWSEGQDTHSNEQDSYDGGQSEPAEYEAQQPAAKMPKAVRKRVGL
jgi:hypothetical protein